MAPTKKIAFLGFGEAAQAFLKGWRSSSGFAAEIGAYDIKTDSPDAAVRETKWADYATWRVEGARRAPEAVMDASLVFSVVTADQAHQAARRSATRPCARRAVLRLRFLRPADQTAERARRRRRWRSLCRRRGHGARASTPARDPAADRRPACERRRRGAEGARHEARKSTTARSAPPRP